MTEFRDHLPKVPLKLGEYSPEFSFGSVASDPTPTLVFGGTQCGRISHTSNQDASAFCVSETFAVLVVSDGCGGKPARYWGRTSCNDVASKLLSFATCDFLKERLSNRQDLGSISEEVEAHLLQRIEQLSRTMDPDGRHSDFRHGYLTATVLFAIVTQEEYCVCGSGDGVFCVNGEWAYLEEQAGEYLSLIASDRAANRNCPGITTHRNGARKDLQTLLIGTDGFGEFSQHHESVLNAFLASAQASVYEGGYCAKTMFDFNEAIWRDPQVQGWIRHRDSSDDSTFLCALEKFEVPGSATTSTDGEFKPARKKKKPIGSNVGTEGSAKRSAKERSKSE